MLSRERELNFINREDIKDIYFVGDTHGEFQTFRNNLLNNSITNSIIVICGDVGIGFHKPSYYEAEAIVLQQLLETTNNYVCFVRGNHDNPHYFTEEGLKTLSEPLKFGFDRIHFVKDYDVILTDFGNILAVGGGISIDRTVREFNKAYWPNEFVKPLSIDTFRALGYYNIDIVVSHSAPACFLPYGVSASIVNHFQQYDKMLKHDLIEERAVLQEVYNSLMNDWSPTHWYYGHYHSSYYDILYANEKEIISTCLSCHEFKRHTIGFE